MQSFKSIIGGDTAELKNLRVRNAEANVLSESKMAIEKLKSDYRALQNEIEALLDLGPTDANDLASNLKDVNASQLISSLGTKSDSLSVLARKIKIRVAIHNTLFPEDRVADLTPEELDYLNGLV